MDNLSAILQRKHRPHHHQQHRQQEGDKVDMNNTDAIILKVGDNDYYIDPETLYRAAYNLCASYAWTESKFTDESLNEHFKGNDLVPFNGYNSAFYELTEKKGLLLIEAMHAFTFVHMKAHIMMDEPDFSAQDAKDFCGKYYIENHVDSKNFMPDENCKNVIKEAMSLIDAASSEEELRKTWKFIDSFSGIYEMHIRKSGFDEIREYKENKSQELKKTTEGDKVDMTI